MNRPLCSLLVVAALSAVAVGQNQPTVDELQTKYNDALKQLNAAQGRKNELDAENAKLQKKIDDQAKQLQDKQEELDSVRNRSYFLQAHYTAWEQFVDTNPMIKAMWTTYFQTAVPDDVVTRLFGDSNWPFTLPD